MNIIQYNILDGCRDRDRFDKLDRWFLKQNYDIAGFNELNDWSSYEFGQYAEKWGFSHHFLFTKQTSSYLLGIMSKFPIELVETMDASFEHGFIHVKIKDVHFFITHLSATDSVQREREAALIAERIHSLEEPAALMGDLNTLSPYDAQYYENIGLTAFLAKHDKLARKFLVNGQINYLPMRILLDAGLTDTGALRGFQNSVPTSFNEDEMHAGKLRLDYFLSNKALMNRNPYVTILHGDDFELLSDHYPLECRF